MNLATLGKDAVARYEARHATADDLQHNCAGFTWSEARGGTYEVTVRGYVVLVTARLWRVRDFCAMHNGRMAESAGAA